MQDRGTEVEIAGPDLDEALDMMFMFRANSDFSDDLGALQHNRAGCWCCTALFARDEVEICNVKAFRHWHVQQPPVWQEGYHIWGCIVADKRLMKSQRVAGGTQDLFNLIMHKKVTLRGLLAWLVITSPAMLIASYIVLAPKLDNFGVRLIRGV